MIGSLLNGDPQVVTTRLPRLMLPSFLACFVCAWLDAPGLLSSFQIASLAVSAVVFDSYRSERGLWMLAALFFAIWAVVSATLAYGQLVDWVRGVATPLSLAIDFAISTVVLQVQVRFLWATAKHNLRLSRTHAPEFRSAHDDI